MYSSQVFQAIYKHNKALYRDSKVREPAESQRRIAKMDTMIKAIVPSAARTSIISSNLIKYTLPIRDDRLLENIFFELEKIPDIKVLTPCLQLYQK